MPPGGGRRAGLLVLGCRQHGDGSDTAAALSAISATASVDPTNTSALQTSAKALKDTATAVVTACLAVRH